MLSTKETYWSVDIESDGPIPGPNSMLSIGAVAFASDGNELSSFSANLELLSEAKGDPVTMKWWNTQPKAWEICRSDLQKPVKAMTEFKQLINLVSQSEGTNPVMVGFPAGFDFMFVHWYLINFTGSSPFSHSCMDIKTLMAATMKKGYRKATKRNMPDRWKTNANHSHVAVEDAREQGQLMFLVANEYS